MKKSNKKYRECKVEFNNFYEDLDDINGKEKNLKFSDLKLIFKD